MPTTETPTTETPAQTGYAPGNGLQMYYEIHGSGGTPLLLLHGGLFTIDLQFGELIPGLAATRQLRAHRRSARVVVPAHGAGGAQIPARRADPSCARGCESGAGQPEHLAQPTGGAARVGE